MRVLYVEDDAMNRKVMRAMLSSSGATMSEAVDGQAGVDAVERDEFDLVLMDLRMPGMDGLTAIKHIRQRGDAKARLPIIVVTADTAPNMREDCLRIGADDVVYKPVAVKLLFSAIGQVLSRR
ncbi:Transcriptional activator protein CzcR [Alphaproteobacteria bacterium SO-S41]|nr:Transcriptional activator protein CzcR [Alphaproteobacteria bacterium SO-S41]